ncbi:AI-2E family transporter [Oceanobacillus piezotolerans]|uniref:AI-2E family transporter n=1 Tax=Oceanobacillus piezotolerans TaxID=2448030 RepID=A0A498D902_9BACI|nr:AI-2E family transporter [Oceanobacillus piezotolerans]RLL43657.1 AI-2E family transporter [Oceanobacillus piezotolerans]
MVNRRSMQYLTFFILIFLLIWIINKTNFIFQPLLQYIGAIAFPLIVGGLLYYLTRPLLHFFERRLKMNRIWAIIAVFIVLILAITLFILYIWPIARTQVMNLVNAVPDMVRTVEDFISYLQSNNSNIPDQVNNAIDNFFQNIPQYLQTVVDYLFSFLGSFIGQIVNIVIGLFMVPFFLFFMLKDGEKLVPFILQVFKKEKASNLRELLRKLDHVLSSYIHGQLLVSFFVGVLLLIGYLIIGLDYALILALFGMVTNVIPYLGPYLAVIPAIIVGAIQDPINVIWVAIVMIIAQQIEGNLITPNVMGQALHVHPLTVLTIIFAAGNIAGLLGIILAVPVYALTRTIIVHFYQTFVKTRDKKEDALL